jgi:hypothetical protein
MIRSSRGSFEAMGAIFCFRVAVLSTARKRASEWSST